MKNSKIIVLLLTIVSIMFSASACSGETAQEEANRKQREAWQAYQDANEAYERAKKANEDFNNAINNYNARNGK
ncbi:MAG: hypothetical protein IJL25_10040 [Clostridia bacterium]|nr:hypothetical protein [Clostridia bacterium]